MRYRITFIAGFAVGFITGARAGRERYEQIKNVGRKVMDNPAVQQAAGALHAQAGDLAQTARHKVGGKVPGLRGDGAGNGEAYFPGSETRDSPPARH